MLGIIDAAGFMPVMGILAAGDGINEWPTGGLIAA